MACDHGEGGCGGSAMMEPGPLGLSDIGAVGREYPQFGKSVWNVGRKRGCGGRCRRGCTCGSRGSQGVGMASFWAPGGGGIYVAPSAVGPADVGGAPEDAPPGESWEGHSHGVSVEPGKDPKGKPDPCLSIITIHFWLDGEASAKNGCLPNFFSSNPHDLEGVDLDSLFSEARSILEGKRFACPCKDATGKKCWLEFRIKVHANPQGDGNEETEPVPVVLNCRCKKKLMGRQMAHNPRPGEYVHGPHKLKLCWPLYPTAPHTLAHETMHALGLSLGSDMYDPKTGRPLPGWKDTLMGDAHGTDISQRDLCSIATANKACRVPGRGKDKVCCGAFPAPVPKRARQPRAVTVPIPAASAPDLPRNRLVQFNTMLPGASTPSTGAHTLSGLVSSAWEAV